MVELWALPPSAPETTIFEGKGKDLRCDLRKPEASTLGATSKERLPFAEIHSCPTVNSMLGYHCYSTNRGAIPERSSGTQFAYR